MVVIRFYSTEAKNIFKRNPHVEVIHLSGKTFVAVEIQYLSKMTLDNEEFCEFY